MPTNPALLSWMTLLLGTGSLLAPVVGAVLLGMLGFWTGLVVGPLLAIGAGVCASRGELLVRDRFIALRLLTIILLLIVWGLAILPLFVATTQIFNDWRIAGSNVLSTLIAVSGPLALAATIAQVRAWRRLFRRLAVAWEGNDCALCGYPLKGLTGSSCPECGATIPRQVLARLQRTGRLHS